jgi:hypothetical protein
MDKKCKYGLSAFVIAGCFCLVINSMERVKYGIKSFGREGEKDSFGTGFKD